MKKLIIGLSVSSLLLSASAFAAPQKKLVDNPFGANVYIFEQTTDINTISSTVNKIYSQQKDNDFGDQRYAFLFMPGKYGTTAAPLDVKVGFYTAVAGMGKRPEDVVITGAVRNQDRSGGSGATMLFWRSIENLAIVPTLGSITDQSIPKDQNVWACSQGAPLRRLRIMNGSLRLYDVSWSSGGLLADSRIDKTVFSGTQQQWLTRNSSFGNWDGKNWNIVFVGDFGTIPGGTWPNPPYTIVQKTPLIKEKPYLYFDTVKNQFVVNVRTRRRNVAGTDWHIEGTSIPLSSFYVAKPGASASELNAALAQGKQLFFTPGVYHLTDSINITKANTVVYGLGFPSLVSDTGKPVIKISDVENVQVAGILIDGGPVNAESLMVVGDAVNTTKHTDPVYLYDIFCRIGGPNSYRSIASSCMTINSNDVVADYLWIWRADHGSNVGWTVNPSGNGIVINGNNVIAYNLMSEHHEKYQVLWNGSNGQTYEFQAEPPYDVPNQQAWMDGNSNGYAAYRIGDNGANNMVAGIGVYSNFNNSVWEDSAVRAPVGKGNKLSHIILFWLNGNGNSGIRHAVNADGCGASQGSRQCNYPGWQS